MAPYSSSSIIQFSGSPETPNWFWKALFTPLTRDRARAPTSDWVFANAFSFVATVKGPDNVFQISVWCLRDSGDLGFTEQDAFTSPFSPHLLQLFSRICRRSFPMKLQRSFVDFETWPDFPLARGGADNDCQWIWVKLSVTTWAPIFFVAWHGEMASLAGLCLQTKNECVMCPVWTSYNCRKRAGIFDAKRLCAWWHSNTVTRAQWSYSNLCVFFLCH